MPAKIHESVRLKVYKDYRRQNTTHTELAEKYNISPRSVCNIVNEFQRRDDILKG